MKLARRCLVLAVLAIWAGAAVAQEASSFPTRPIRIIVPFPAGGPSDIVARVIGQKMSEDSGPAGGDREPARRQHAHRRPGGREGRA